MSNAGEVSERETQQPSI